MFTESLPNLNLWGIDNSVYLWYSLVMLGMEPGSQQEIETMKCQRCNGLNPIKWERTLNVWGEDQNQIAYYCNPCRNTITAIQHPSQPTYKAVAGQEYGIDDHGQPFAVTA